MLPSKSHLTFEQLSDMLQAQFKLNNAYNGQVWVTDPTFLWKFNAAADAELAEYLEEITALWKWYSSKPVLNQQEALFEGVDVLHFMLAGLLKAAMNWKMNGEDLSEVIAPTLYERYTDPDLQLNAVDTEGFFYRQISRNYREFWRHVNNLFTAEYWRQDSLEGALVALLDFAACIAVSVGYDASKLYEAYKLKNDRNHERVMKGVMKGVDVKKAEEPLCLT